MTAPWRLRRRRLAVVVSMGALLVSGCSGIPDQSPVVPGLEVGPPEYDLPRVQLRPPAPGASPAEIITGFLDAASSPEDDFSAARAYLTGEAAGGWEPGERVTVYPNGADIRPTVTDGTATLDVPVVGRLDSTGRYVTGAAGETATPTLEVRRVEGEWRISRLPEAFGLWLSSEWFGYLYRRADVTYVDPFDNSLITDPRWVPSGRSGPTALVEAQLHDVPAYLRGAAVTGVPPGTALGVNSVPIVEGVAQVELTAAMKRATVDQRKAAWAQLLTTLRQWPGVRAVSISVDGDPLPLVGDESRPMNVTELPASVADLGFVEPPASLPSVVLRNGTRLAAQDLTGWLRGGENQRAVESALPPVSTTWTHLAMGTDLGGDRRTIVGVDAARTTLLRWTPEGTGDPLPLGTSLTEPAVDRRNRVWIGGTDPAGRARVWMLHPQARPDATPTALSAGWLRGRVDAVKTSPGGRRLAIALTDAQGRTSIQVTGIIVGQGRSPVALADPWRVAAGLTDLRDLTWVDDESLAVIAGRGGRSVTPAIVPLGDEITPLDPVEDGRQIVGTGSEGSVLVITSGGDVWKRAGSGAWQQQDDADEVIVPGA